MAQRTMMHDGREMIFARQFGENLACELTDEHCHELGNQLATIQGQLEELAAERKEANDDFKERADELKKLRASCARKMRDRSEERMTQCAELVDIDGAEQLVVRLDDKAVVRRRTLSGRELDRHRQRDLPVEDDGDGDELPLACECGHALPDHLADESIAEHTCESCGRFWYVDDDVWKRNPEADAPNPDEATPKVGEQRTRPDGTVVECVNVDPGGGSSWKVVKQDEKKPEKKPEPARLPDAYGGELVSCATSAPLAKYLRDEGLPVPVGKDSRKRRRSLVALHLTGSLRRPEKGLSPRAVAAKLEERFGPFEGGDV